jgi:hypothetical protein
VHTLKNQRRGNKLVVELDFAYGNGQFIDLARSADSNLCFIRYNSRTETVEFLKEIELKD